VFSKNVSLLEALGNWSGQEDVVVAQIGRENVRMESVMLR
jgi:hypothetical protein